MREIFFDEKLEETRRNSEGCKPHGQRERWVGWVGWVGWEQWERWDNPRLTYLAIADNPEGGLAGKGMWVVRAGRNFGGETRRG